MPLLAVPNLTARPSTASVPITVLLFWPTDRVRLVISRCQQQTSQRVGDVK